MHIIGGDNSQAEKFGKLDHTSRNGAFPFGIVENELEIDMGAPEDAYKAIQVFLSFFNPGHFQEIIEFPIMTAGEKEKAFGTFFQVVERDGRPVFNGGLVQAIDQSDKIPKAGFVFGQEGGMIDAVVLGWHDAGNTGFKGVDIEFTTANGLYIPSCANITEGGDPGEGVVVRERQGMKTVLNSTEHKLFNGGNAVGQAEMRMDMKMGKIRHLHEKNTTGTKGSGSNVQAPKNMASHKTKEGLSHNVRRVNFFILKVSGISE